MPTSPQEMIKYLLDERQKAIKEEREFHSSVQAQGEMSQEDKAKLERYGKTISELGDRAEYLMKLEETNRHMDAQRERFNSLLPSSQEANQDSVDKNAEKWFRQTVSDEPGWQPRHLELHFTDYPQAAWESHDLVKSGATTGGNLVPVGFLPELFRVLTEQSAIRQTNARVIRTSSGEDLRVPKVTSTGAAVIVSEGNAIPESDPAFGQVTIGAHKYANMMQVSRELLEDSAINLSAELASIAAQQIADGNGPHLVTGTGTGQPQGIANSYVLGPAAIANAAALDADTLIDLYFSVRSPYRTNGYWVMNDATVQAVRKLKYSGSGEYILAPGSSASGGLAVDTIFGKPVVTDPTMSTGGAAAGLVAFGDFSKYYLIRDVDGVRFERSDDFAFANDLVSFRVIFRTDAKQMVNDAAGSAVKFIRTTA